MRKAMAEAEVGDDVFHEDPSVNRLEEMVAALYGKDAAVYVASGTMANQLAIRAQTHHGDEIIMERTSHPFNSEAGALAALAGVQVNLVDGQQGIMDAEQIRAVVRTANVHHAPTALICLENTHNRGGGSIWPLDKIRAIREVAASNGVPMHLDGARLLNACVTTGLAPRDYAQYFDSCTLCLSKGLGAPVGSLVIGSRHVVERAHRFRKQFGGGMRQAGILAAAGSCPGAQRRTSRRRSPERQAAGPRHRRHRWPRHRCQCRRDQYPLLPSAPTWADSANTA